MRILETVPSLANQAKNNLGPESSYTDISGLEPMITSDSFNLVLPYIILWPQFSCSRNQSYWANIS